MIVAWPQHTSVIALDHEQHRSLVTVPYLFAEFCQVPRGALADGIGKIGAAIGVYQMAILYFDKMSTLTLGEQQVDARPLPVGDLAPKLPKTTQPRYQACLDQSFRETIGGLGVGTRNQAVDFQQFQRVLQFPFSSRWGGGHPGSRAGPQHTFHTTGVHAMGINFPVTKSYAGNKSVVAGEKGSFEERAGMGEKHQPMVATPAAFVLQSWFPRVRILALDVR